MDISELSEQEIVRRNSLEQIKAMGIEPYPAAEYKVDGYATEIKENFSDDAPVRQVSVAGRIMSRRIMGKASFMAEYRYMYLAMRFVPMKIKISTMYYSKNY